MKKVMSLTEATAEGSEQLQKLWKQISECVRQVDGSTGAVGVFTSLFSPPAVTVRTRLRDLCERVLLTCPGPQMKRVDDILWKKVYYEPISAAKNFKKNGVWTKNEQHWISCHLNEGLAYYHSLLLCLENKYSWDSVGVDFITQMSADDALKSSENVHLEVLHHCLVCLGDLARYTLDLPMPMPSLAARYYLQALNYDCDVGLTHSNLAMVYTSNGQSFLAVAHLLRAMICEKPSHGVEVNLKKALEMGMTQLRIEDHTTIVEKEKARSKMFLQSVLTLLSRVFTEECRAEEIASICQKGLVHLSKALENLDGDNIGSDRSSSPLEGASNGFCENVGTHEAATFASFTVDGMALGAFFSTDSILMIMVVLVLSTSRLQLKGSPHTSMLQAMLVSLLLTLISHVIGQLEQRISLVDPQFVTKLLPPEKKEVCDDVNETQKEGEIKEGEKKGKKRSIRRRRRVSGTADTSDVEDVSDGEEDQNGVSSSESDDDDDDDLNSSEDDEDVKIESDQEWDGLTASEHMEFIGQESLLQVIYVGCDWLRRNDDVISLCVQSADSLWAAVARLLNLLRVDWNQLKQDSTCRIRKEMLSIVSGSEESNDSLSQFLHATPLPEEVTLHTLLPTLTPLSKQSLNLKSVELNVLRLQRLFEFGKSMSIRSDTPLKNDETTNSLFVISLEKKVAAAVKVAMPVEMKAPKMANGNASSTTSLTRSDVSSATSSDGHHSLTSQWLQHEVRNLEERTTRRGASLGLYLVPSAGVLISHLAGVKRVVANSSYMVIIPQMVIESLDEQKRDSVGAREAIRWLEVKFRNGSRFIRSQRPHEKSHLPLIKYPKKKYRDAWKWFQIFECCHYLSSQVNHGHNRHGKAPSPVTLLVGEGDHCDSFSLPSIAEMAGASLESMDAFMQKWKDSTKGYS